MPSPSFQEAQTPPAMRVVGYVRVSTDEQGVSGLGLEAQRAAIDAECRRRGWQLVRVEQDVAGGAKLDRPGLNAAVLGVASGDVDGLVVASSTGSLARSPTSPRCSSGSGLAGGDL